MSDPSPNRFDFGQDLSGVGVRQPSGSFTVDAFGLAQAQLTFAVSTDGDNFESALQFYSQGPAYPDTLLYPLIGYKTHVSFGKAGVAMFTIDYMGVWRASGYTDAQITGIANTTAQPIETHPNFTLVTDNTIGTDSPTQLLAGTWNAKAPGTDPIFNEVKNADGTTAHTFGGFAVSDDPAYQNPKAGIRQFLRPMYSVRGVIFFNTDAASSVSIMTNGIGRTLNNDQDMFTLVTPQAILGAISAEMCLLTAASAECIGIPSGFSGIKVTYDIMIGGEIGWDQDIYGKMQDPIF
ncbi:hypothetical protein [Sphingorhabdus sp.]|uniref:hypothetical protein n=1 Tax=Sphingorhabdus sp. TaxID=1902408 RepID=UPI00334249C2